MKINANGTINFPKMLFFVTLTCFTISVQAYADIRHDGVYRHIAKDSVQGAYHYFRFYPDSTVISATSTGQPDDLQKWFSKEYAIVSRGSYTIQDNHLTFSIIPDVGGSAVDYSGEIRGEVIHLDSYNHYNRQRYSNDFLFVQWKPLAGARTKADQPTLRAGRVALSDVIDARSYFDGDTLVKRILHGSNAGQRSFCKGKIDVDALGISSQLLANSDDMGVSVSSDERYFVFSGRYGRHSEGRYFLVNITDCGVMRELTIDKADGAYDSFDYRATFSPDSKKLFISWYVWSREDVNDPQREAFWLTKEYSGPDFNAVRTLATVVIPSPVSNGSSRPIYPYRFSRDGGYFLREARPKKLPITSFPGWAIYNVKEDKEIFVMDADNYKDFFGEGRLLGNGWPPDIFDGTLLFSFQSYSKSEIVSFDYRSKRVISRIEVPQMAVGIYSSDGDKIIVSMFPKQNELKKKVVIYEKISGKLVGQAEIDSAADVVDISENGRKLLLMNGEKLLVK